MPEMAKLRTAYQSYVADLLKLAGLSDPAGRAGRIMGLETKIAAAHADRVTSEDVHKANNPATLEQLSANAPGLDWKAYLGVALLFCVVHGNWWLTAIGWGLMIGGLLAWTRSLGACIVMHAVTNLLLGLYVLRYRDWAFW